MTDEVLNKKDFIINLTIEGTEYEDVEVKVTKPELPIREQIQRIVKVFELPAMDRCGDTIQYVIGQMLEDSDEPVVLEFEDEEGREQSFRDYNILSGDCLHLLSVPAAYACPVPSKMEQEFYDDNFIIFLTIDGTQYEEEEVRVSDPNKTIRNQIDSIIRVFELPEKDNGGNCIQYLLGQMIEDGEEPEVLDFEDEDGREMSLLDYNIQPGDYLHLMSVPIAGYACPVPSEMEKEWKQYYQCNL